MSLFQNSVLNKYLKGLESEKVNQAYVIFTSHFHNPTIQENIRNSKEEQYQGEFLIDLFVNVLGYIKNPTPDFNLTTELKNIKDSKKTDGAILKGEKALAVIELKGTNTTDLSKVETQAFGYKNNQPGCNYVITSNFEKLRFYIDNAVDFEEFNLFQLTKERFDILWLCLSSEYLLKDIPKKIKDESLTKEENITKELYKDYASFRNEIFASIQNENPEYNKLTLFKKTQKLLDRFLFIFFAEDRLLLPPNSIRSIVNQWTDLRDKYDEYFPLYDRFQKYFGYMNTGHKGQQHDIFAYNGGLFAPDEILDNIKINDDLLHKHTVNLSNYDFESEVSVNILGHIFEHSLNDIDEIQAEINGVVSEQSKTKRKKDGVFYTPKYITKYIVDFTVGKLCEEKKTELNIQEEEYEKERKGRKKATLKKLTQKLEDYRKWLLQITICDPACGSGAFLNQALEFLILEHSYIDELQAKLFGDAMVLSEVENAILENNIYGVDINNESIEIAKLSLWLRTAQKGRKLTSLNNNIKCGNSLIDDINVARDKSFNWQKEFPEVFAKGGFDIVIGNPPYGASFNNDEKIFFRETYSEIHKRTPESFNYFLYRIENIINTSSKWGVIIPSSFLYQHEFEKTRKYILDNSTVNKVINLGDDVFQDVATPTCIIVASKKGNKSEYVDLQTISRYLLPIEIFEENKLVNASSLIENESFSYIVKQNRELIQKCYAQPRLKEIAEEVATGISSGFDKAYVYTKEEYTKLNLENSLLKKLIIGGEINRYRKATFSTKKIIYITSENKIEDYPIIESNLLPHKERLIKRREAANGKIAWYSLNWPRRKKLFDEEKILIRQTANKILAALDTEKWYCLKSGLIIQLNENSTISYNYLTGLLNSKLMDFLYQDLVGEGGRVFPEVKPVQLFKLPIKIPNIEDKNDLLQSKNIESKVHQIQKDWNELIDKQRQFLEYLQAKYNITKPSKSLQKWLKLDSTGLLSELKKAKVSLEVKTEMELLKFFKEEIKEVTSYKERIEKTDNEIDQLVYELYGLTKDEIRIVEEANA